MLTRILSRLLYRREIGRVGVDRFDFADDLAGRIAGDAWFVRGAAEFACS